MAVRSNQVTAAQRSHASSQAYCCAWALSLAATSCGSQVDGDQWVAVTVTNTTVKSVTLDTHPARSLSPGQKTVLNVNSNNDPQAVSVKDAEGRVLGCLVFPLHTDLPEMRSASVSDVTACDEKVHSFPG
ncbi:hypothetical protein GCM10027405_26530 [Arthrobacter alkaliphilus]